MVQSEYKKRLCESQPNRLSRYVQPNSKSIYYAELDSASTIKIFKPDSHWKEVKTVAHNISRSNFGWAFDGKNLYILGGHVSGKKVQYFDKVRSSFFSNAWYVEILQTRKYTSSRMERMPQYSGDYDNWNEFE